MQRLAIPPETEFGDLSVVREVESRVKRCFLCRCQCGREVEVRLDHLRSGHTTSCGKCGLEHNSQRKTLRAWAASINVKETTLRARLKTMGLAEALKR